MREFDLSEIQEHWVRQMIGKRQSYEAAVREIHRVQFMKNRGGDRTELSVEGVAIVLHAAGFDTLGDSEKQAKIQQAKEEDEKAEELAAQAEQEAEIRAAAEKKVGERKIVKV